MSLLMNTLALGLLAVGQSSTYVPASGGPEIPRVDVEANATGTSADPILHLVPQDWPITVRGWIDAGYMGNPQGPPDKFNGPYNSVERANEPMLNQAYLIFEKQMKQDFGVGFRVDLLYGSDYNVAQSFGWEIARNGANRWNSNEYIGLANPQLFVEIGNLDASLKVGHFYTVVGYESVMSANNFFYTRSYSYQFAGPFTNWGGLGSIKVLDNAVTVQAGLVNGWNALEQQGNYLGFTGSIRYDDPAKRFWTSAAFITGNEATNPGGVPGVPNAFANRTRSSILLGLTPGDKLEYVFHQWAGFQDDGTNTGGTAAWYGIDQYLYYRLADQWRAGLRFEWFRDVNGTRVGLTETANVNKLPLPGNYYSLTGGVNYTPYANVILRPEIRYDFYDGSAKPFNDGKGTDQLLLGLDVIVHF